MKQIVLIIIASILTLKTFVVPVSADTNYNHAELMEYEGYGKALYEATVRETTFLTTQYEDNRDYANGIMEEVADYSRYIWDESVRIGDISTHDNWNPVAEIREATASGMGLLMTVGDWVKKLFTGFEKDKIDAGPVLPDYSGFDSYLLSFDKRHFQMKPGYSIEFTMDGDYGVVGWKKRASSGTLSFYGANTSDPDKFSIKPFITGTVAKEVFVTQSEYNAYVSAMANATTLGECLAVLSAFNVSAVVVKESDNSTVPPTSGGSDNNDYSRFYNYINNYGGQMVVPQIKPVLSCSDGTTVNLTINGNSFNKGVAVVDVNKNGTAIYNGVDCTLSWLQPSLDIIDDKPVIEDDEGNWRDLETGEIIKQTENVPDRGEGCDGVLCFLAGLTKGIADLAKSIGGLVKGILDGLLGLFVPKDLNFISTEFTKLKTNFDGKLAIVGTLKSTMTGAFDSGGESPLTGLEMSLPAMGGESVKVVETSFVEPYVGTIKKIISGILVFVTLIYLYRKITGRGGVMEK